MEKIRVLLVEDEAVLAAIVKESLETRGFEITVAANGVEGWSLFNQYRPDLCIIDIMLPRKDGLSLLTDIRLVDELIPVIFLTAKTQTADVLKGLETGADDYMKKPFSMEELVLRLKALVRRRGQKNAGTITASADVAVGAFRFNYQGLELAVGANSIALSQREADLLHLLLLHKNQLLDRKTALIKLWGQDTVFNARSMDVYITRLRKFFRNDASLQIVNIRAKGYMLKERS